MKLNAFHPFVALYIAGYGMGVFGDTKQNPNGFPTKAECEIRLEFMKTDVAQNIRETQKLPDLRIELAGAECLEDGPKKDSV